ncbi:gliding motility protein GldL [Spongiivirga sp. MCCC 1A20706]|uniref:type IX secretion system motor protein PorL/GldL n=1 Tax=Spongiivirga sp. MCCC 1A20706 TaxID=3160963 RepID=UPI0039777136
MAQSKATKKVFNMAYGLGASIVILGALFKILHWEIDLGFIKLSGGFLLALGLITEALIFAISAFEPVEDDLDWSLVYPELAGGQATGKKKSQAAEAAEAEGMLSKKLDDMLKEAKVDANLMSSLGESIKNFEGAAKGISPTVDAIQSTKKYGEELSLAAAQMESLNSLYKVQLESAEKQASVNEEVAANAGKLKDQMESLASNLSSLNGVYGGMLSAMNKN